jgi:hypothetical protein
MADMKKVVVCAPLRRRADRAKTMRTLLQRARPHGGNTGERVKQGRPNDRSA